MTPKQDPTGEIEAVTLDDVLPSLCEFDESVLSVPWGGQYAMKDVPQLAVYEPLVGRWEIDANIKPSIHAPEGTREKSRCEVNWCLGGRFLMGDEYKDNGEPKNVW